MIDYNKRRQRKRKFFNNLTNLIWSVICFAGAIVLLILIIKWCTPWLSNLGNTVM